jgi:hypothetical protein
MAINLAILAAAAVSLIAFSILVPSLMAKRSEPEPLITQQLETEDRVVFDRAVNSGVLLPNQTLQKTIGIESAGILEGQFTVHVKGPLKIEYWLKSPTEQAVFSQTFSSVSIGIDGTDVLGILLGNSPDILHKSGRLAFVNRAGASDVEKLDLRDSIVLAERGGMGKDAMFIEKMRNVAAKGAKVLVIYNDRPGIFFGALTKESIYEADIPVVAITKEDGLLLRKLAESNVMVKFAYNYVDADLKIPAHGLNTLLPESGNYTVWFHNNGPSKADVTFEYSMDAYDSDVWDKVSSKDMVVVANDFTYSAYGGKDHKQSFSEYYRTGNTASLTVPFEVDYSARNFIYQRSSWSAGITPLNTVVIGDTDLHRGYLSSEKPDAVILTHQEYVTGEEYNALKEYVKGGGTLILLSGNSLYAEIAYDNYTNTITLVGGHGYEPGRLLNQGVKEGFDRSWLGSRYCGQDLDAVFINYRADCMTSGSEVLHDWGDEIFAYRTKYGNGTIYNMGIFTLMHMEDEIVQGLLKNMIAN